MPIRHYRQACCLALLSLPLLVSGCAVQTPGSAVAARPVSSFHVRGAVHGGQQPVAGSSIQIYSVNYGYDGIPATPLLAQPVLTDANGNFNLSGTYTCPAQNNLTYITATGGNPGIPGSAGNPNIAAIAFTDVCSSLQYEYLNIDEVTTAASIATFGQFFTQFPSLGISPTNDAAAYSSYYYNYLEIVDPTTGMSPGPKYDSAVPFPFKTLYLLADVMASCVNSNGGVAGDSSACGNLFALSTPPAGTAPTNTVDALLNLWRNPNLNVSQIAALSSPSAPFQPAESKPANWYQRLGPTAVPKFFQCTTYGDSLTEGSEDSSGVTIAKQLATLPSCYTGNNQGVGGNNASQIAIREGGLQSTGTVQGGTIPASGPVDVTFPSTYSPVTASGPGILKVNFNGVDGQLQFDYGNGDGTFTRDTAGSPVSSPANSPYTVNAGTQNNGFVLIWAGRNNLGDTQRTMTAINAMIAALPSPQRYLVLSLTNTVMPDEQAGQPGYMQVLSTNQALQSAYPNNYLDIRTPVIAAYDPNNGEDVIDHGHDVPPSTLRAIDVYGNLTGALDNATCSFAATPNTLFTGYTMNIEQEKILLLNADGTNSVQCIRGYGGTTAVAHASNTPFSGTDYVHLNAKADTLIAKLVDQWIQANY